MLPAAREVRSQESAVRIWDKLKSLVLDSLTSPHSRRAYGQALDHFHVWAARNSPEGFTKATVQRYRLALEQQGLAPSSIKGLYQRSCHQPQSRTAETARRAGSQHAGAAFEFRLHGIHHTLKIQRVLDGQDWMSRITKEDRRGLTTLLTAMSILRSATTLRLVTRTLV